MKGNGKKSYQVSSGKVSYLMVDVYDVRYTGKVRHAR